MLPSTANPARTALPTAHFDRNKIPLRFNIDTCHRSFLPLAAAIGLAAAFVAQSNRAKLVDADFWIDTWTARPQPVWDAEFFAPINIPRAVRNQTVRQIAALSIGGNRVRVVLSNEYGTKPLVIGAAHIALAGPGAFVVVAPIARSALTANPRSPFHRVHL